MDVFDVLVNTSAAAPEIGTARLDSMRGSRKHGLESRLEKFFVLAYDPCRNSFPVDNIRNKDGLPAAASDSFAAKSDVLDF